MAAKTTYADDLIAQLDSGVAVYEAVDGGADFVFVDINTAVERTDHVRREALVGKRLTEVFPGVEEFGLLDVLRRVWRTGTPEVLPPAEYHDQRISGWRSNRIYRLPSGCVVAVYEDVTQRMQTELALKASEDRYRLLTESSIDGIWDWNVAENTLYLSPKWKAQLGFKDDELENSFETFIAHLHPEDSTRVMQHLKLYLDERNPHWEEEFRLLHKDGHYIWLLARGTAVFDDNGKVGRMLGVHIDIDRRKQAEAEAAVIRERLQATLQLNQDAPLENENNLIQEALEQVVQLTDSQVGYCHFVNDDQETIALITWSRETLKACTAAFDSHYPISQAGIWADCIRKKTPQIHNDYPNQVDRQGLPDGHIGLSRHMSIPVLSGDKVRCVVGVGNKIDPYTHLDIEQAQLFVSDLWRLIEEKRTEDKLKQAAAVIASTQEAVTITDTTPRIVAVNEAFTTITGFSEEEVLGRDPGMLKSGRHDPSFYEDMWHQLTANGRWQGEIWNRRKSGEIYPEWLTITTIYDDSGLPSHFAAVFSDISRLKQSEERLAHLAHYDPLTGLPNRILLISRIEHAMQRASRTRGRMAVLFLDLDNFKNVNDSLGHPAGDELLKSIGKRLSKRLRIEDTVARIGGDEFVILVEDFTDDVHIAEIAENLIEEIAKPIDVGGHEFFVGGSIGISLYPEDGDNVTDLIKNADAAMYLAKESGRNSFQFYTPQLTEKAQQRLRVESELRQAIRNGQIQAYFQPLARISDDRVVGAEALARWIRDGEEYLSPARFIPIAEEAGLIDEISSTILEQACSELSNLGLSDDEDFTLAINISPRQFHGRTLAETISHSLQDHDLPGSRFEFELTETVLMKNAARSTKQLFALKSLGASIAIDDFGTGFSSLAYLTEFPIDKLKIDRSFVNRLQHSANDLEIVATILAMADKLGMVVVAEGVETATQLARLRELGCDLYQGFFLGRPSPAGTLAKILAARDPVSG